MNNEEAELGMRVTLEDGTVGILTAIYPPLLPFNINIGTWGCSVYLSPDVCMTFFR